MRNIKEMPDDELVCFCQRVDKGTIVRAIKAGADTLSRIRETTTACTGGNCKQLNPSGKCCSGDIRELIRLYQE